MCSLLCAIDVVPFVSDLEPTFEDYVDPAMQASVLAHSEPSLDVSFLSLIPMHAS